ncbi:MAG: DUF4825 domain-containing protein [Lachnospiraceae bacterium]|nr:DUF4825 domain-containing protein [Lachnospiraceae bacterium]
MIETIITSSILIICIILLRRLCRGKISAGVQYALWLIVALRLIVPAVMVVFPNLLPEWDLSIMNVAEKVGTNAQDYMQEPVNIGQINVPFGKLPFVNVANDGPTAVFVAGQIGWTWLDFFKGIWYAGIVIAGVWMAAVNILFMRRLLANRTKYEKEDYKLPIYYVKELASPCLYGIPGKQAVYLPEEVIEDEERIRHILAHEYCHYKHRDVLWAGLRCILLAVYWFNPLVWLAAVLSKRDCELACDEAAIRMLGEDERIAYGKTLLSLITKTTKASDIVCAATTMTGTGKSIKERIKRIAQKPKRLAVILLPVLVAVGAIVAFTFTQAKEYPEGAFFLEGEGEQLVSTDCFQINFPESIAKEIYCIKENDTDVTIYHKDDKREIGAFRKLIYEEAVALSDEREVVPIGDYGKNWKLKFHMNGGDDSEGVIDGNSISTYYDPYDENETGTGGVAGTDSNADSTYIDNDSTDTESYYGVDSADTAYASNGGIDPIPAPEDVDSKVINLPYDENADYSAVDAGEKGSDTQNEDYTYIIYTEDVSNSTPYEESHDYLPNENIIVTDINDASSTVDHFYTPYTPNENNETEDVNKNDAGNQEAAPYEEAHDYLPNENITVTYTPDESHTVVDHIYTPNENVEAEDIAESQTGATYEESHDYLPSESVHDEGTSTIMLPDDEITNVNIPAYKYCYIYVPADNSDAEENIQEKLAELNQEIIDLSDSVTILFISMDSMEEILDILAGTHRSDINDLPNISEIAQTIPTAEGLSYSMTELSDREPDKITLHYHLLYDDIAKIDQDTLFVDAVLMFSLIEDLETCSFQISGDSEKIKYSVATLDDYLASTVNYNYERSEMEELFGELYPCSETKEEFVDLYNRVVEYLGEQE